MTAAQRLVLDDSTQIIGEDTEGITLEGPLRLRPGREVDIITGRTDGQPPFRRAHVRSWRVTRLGNEGPIYRGYCRWA